MLRKLLNDHFSLIELKALVDDLGAVWDNLPGEILSSKARELAGYMDRHDRSYELLAAMDLTGKGLKLKPYLYLVILDFFGDEDSMVTLLGSFNIEPRNFGGREKFAWGGPPWLKQKAEALQAKLEAEGRSSELLAAIQAESQTRFGEDVDFTFYGVTPPPPDLDPDGPGDDNGEIDPAELEEADEYHNFDLDLEVVGDVFRVAVSGDRGDAKFDHPAALLRDPDLHEQLAYLSGLVARAEDIKKLGEKLRGFLFPPIIWTKYTQYLQASEEAAGLRIRLRFHEDETELIRLPWEYCRDDQDYFALNTATPIIRYLKTGKAPKSIEAPSPVRVLIATASPAGYDSLSVEEEAEAIEKALLSLNDGGQNKVEVKVVHQASMSALDDDIASRRGFRPHILHFVGHGEIEGGEGRLVLDNGSGAAAPVDGATLLRPLRDRKSLVRIVVLNACQTAVAGSDEAIAGLAPRLVWGGIPAVIAMQFPIPDTMATIFAENLYDEMAAGAPLDEAITTARRKASFADASFWGIPALYLRAPDGVVWKRKA